jgi:hypothetical protein
MKLKSLLLTIVLTIPNIGLGLPVKKHAPINLIRNYLKPGAPQQTNSAKRSINPVSGAIPAPYFGQTNVINTSFPIIVSSPGYYVFAEDIFFDGTTASAAITIEPNVGEVTIDLIGYNLNQSVPAAGITAIAIESGNNRVTIRGGTITNFSQSAITVDDLCSEIYIDLLSIVGCGNRAVEFNGSTGIVYGSITNCLMTNNCSLTTADNVLTLSNCSDIIVANCVINNNGITGTTITNALAVVKTTGCNRCVFDTVSVGNNSGNTDVRGFSLNQTTNCAFTNCTVDNLQATAAESLCKGFQLESSTHSTGNKFISCAANNITGNLTVDGFLSGNTADNNRFENCEALFNTVTSSSGIVSGFRATHNNHNQFKECRAHGNFAPSSTVSPYGALGFTIDTCTHTSLQDCRASNQRATGASVGFFVTACTATHVFHCVSEGHNVGFDHAGTFNNQAFLQNMAFKNNLAFSAGFPATAFTLVAGNNTNGLLIPWTNVGIN